MKPQPFPSSPVALLLVGILLAGAPSALGVFSIDESPTEVPVDPGDASDWGLTPVIDDGDGPPAPINLMVPNPMEFDLDALSLDQAEDPFEPSGGAMPGLLISFDDADPGPGTGPPDRGVELYFVDIADVLGLGPNTVFVTSARESIFPLGTDPGPRPADDDVDAFDARDPTAGVIPGVLFSADFPRDGNLGHPGVIFAGGMGPPTVAANPADLGLDDRVDIDALALVIFETQSPFIPPHLWGQKGVLFSVDAEEPAGLMPGDIYFSALDGTHVLLFPLYGDRRDIDAISVNGPGPVEPLFPEVEKSCAKWKRPPDMLHGVNLWTYRVPDGMAESFPLIADDFVSDGRPITDVHWWGSYLDWAHQQSGDPGRLPPVAPEGFVLRWYEDIPAGVDPRFPHSHPGALLGEVFAPIDLVGEAYFGAVTNNWIEPGAIVYEHEYAYTFDLPEPWLEEAGRVYWLGVQAIFPPGADRDPDFRPWGWKTTPPVYGWNDAAVLTYTDGVIWDEPLIYPTPFYPPTHPYTGLPVDMAFVLTTRDCPPADCAKWDRPLDLEIGIDVESWTELEGGPAASPRVADDFVSDGRPIQVVEWYGSYPGWLRDKEEPAGALPMIQPDFFRIGWWTDVPAGADQQVPWSHPGTMIYGTTVRLSEVHQAYAGTVFNPQTGEYEHKYRYELHLEDPWREKQGEVYWLSVQAVFPVGAGGQEDFYPWGWATTPPWMNWNDDAVVTVDGTHWQELYYRDVVQGHPYTDYSVNLAFRLLTDVCPQRCTKWSKPADMELGDDWESWAIQDEAVIVRMADDFISDGRPISDIHWWGSYIDWATQAPMPPGPPPVRPLGFRLRWYEDVPAGVDMKWSHPGALILQTFCPITRANETYYGTVDQYWKGEPHYEHEYQYYCDLENPWPEREGGIYWLEIVAVFGAGDVSLPEFRPWGWKSTRPEEHWNDAAVRSDPTGAGWQEVLWYDRHPAEGKPVDLAFELTTKKFLAPTPICKGNVVRIHPWLPNPDWILLRWTDVVGCGSAHVVQRAPVLDDPSAWQNIYTNTAPLLSNQYLDMLPAGTSRQFYRVQIWE